MAVATSSVLDRPQRWDAAFDPEMTPEAVARLLKLAPFCDMKADNFPKRLSLPDILQHDVRIRRFRSGEIVVREGDYGTSAFMIMSGAVNASWPRGPVSAVATPNGS